MNEMEEECTICGALNTLAEIIHMKQLKTDKRVTYLFRMVHCSSCGTDSAGGLHLHLNKLEMLMALKKQKALSKQS